jgi:hypothetical protein
MKHFKEYIAESARKYDFRIKVAGELSAEKEQQLKTALEKFKVTEFKKVGKTPIQSLPLDFPRLQNTEVCVYAVTLEYPTTQQELTEYISHQLKINQESLAVRRPGEPSEQYQEPQEKRDGALLNDPEYKEAANAKFEDFYGDQYNMNFVKQLTDELKAKRTERGEKIPTSTDK